MKKIIFFNWYIPLSIKDEKIIFWNKYIIYRKWTTISKTKFYYIKYIFSNLFSLFFYKERIKSNIQIFDSIIWCFFYDKTKKNFIFIHSYDIWIWSKIMYKNTTLKTKKILIIILELILWKYIRYKLNKFDCIFTTTYDRYLYIKKNITNNVEFIPIPINEIKIKPKEYRKKIKYVLCPERAEINKWLNFRKKIILEIKRKNPEAIFNFLNDWENLLEFKNWLEKNNIKVQWFPFLKKEELHKKIYESDLVIWIFNNGALSLNNIETMLLKTSIITYDKWWIIKKEKEDLIQYFNKIYLDINFRKNEIEKNYNFAKNTYSLENFKNIFTKYLD